ncbi:MAG: creatininase family protein [Clostridia bacterium]|nr:creatininase family protein [Clostridia bacterium]
MKYTKRMKYLKMETWSSPEASNFVQRGNRPVIIPVGSFEQHGPHAPLGTDTFICLEVCHRIAMRIGAVLLPPVWFGVSDEHMDYTGTITLSPNTLCNLLVEIVLSLNTGGFKDIVILNGHSGNLGALKMFKEQVNDKVRKETNLLVLSYWDKLPDKESKQLSSLEWGLHANEFETSIISSIYPYMVKKMKGISHFPELSPTQKSGFNNTSFKDLMKGSNGVWGDPTQASIKKGKSLMSLIELTLTNYLLEYFSPMDNY